ncbi:hypothetical protein EUGRSUZ_G01656 [Eucalyptus grandis]|uniref:Uncharacterized protein n=2 Tax=Eucalyptus grandis TaxID=71139 RepID=A0ACC3K3J6_EUCGR|nr:hypothetical protein EUGRSUZ_G01656 [Eucalyptus grandis]
MHRYKTRTVNETNCLRVCNKPSNLVFSFFPFPCYHFVVPKNNFLHCFFLIQIQLSRVMSPDLFPCLFHIFLRKRVSLLNKDQLHG